MAAIGPKAIDYYITDAELSPFMDWFDHLTIGAQARIRSRLNRLALGHLGKVNSISGGVHELKFKDKGYPTYRIYFGNDSESLIILLLGGDKSSQTRDIELAKEYWRDYQQNK